MLILPIWTCAQQLKIDAEIRPRTEFAHGLKTLASKNQDPGFYTTQRSRLGLTFESDRVTSRINLQDVRTWGNQPQLVGNEDRATSVHEAWFRLSLDTLHRWHIKGGRQEIIYDDQRMFGNVGWAQQARSHDAFLIRYSGSSSRFDMGLAFNQPSPQLTSNFYNIPGNYKTLQYLWYHRDVSPGLGFSILFMNQGREVSDDLNTQPVTRFNQTTGTHISYQKDKWKFVLRGYYQSGKAISYLSRDLSAWMHGLDITYRGSINWKPTLGYEILSGNDPEEPGKQKAFNPWFGTNHKFNGHMDYFYAGNHLNSAGLVDIYLKSDFPVGNTALGTHLHYFSSHATIPDPDNQFKDLSKSLGAEVDLFVKYSVNNRATIQAGYSQMFGTRTMEVLKGGAMGAISNWAYLMFTVKPGWVFGD